LPGVVHRPVAPLLHGSFWRRRGGCWRVARRTSPVQPNPPRTRPDSQGRCAPALGSSEFRRAPMDRKRRVRRACQSSCLGSLGGPYKSLRSGWRRRPRASRLHRRPLFHPRPTGETESISLHWIDGIWRCLRRLSVVGGVFWPPASTLPFQGENSRCEPRIETLRKEA
jgi:hypothetical protein